MWRLLLIMVFVSGSGVSAQPETLDGALQKHESSIAQVQVFHVILHIKAPLPPTPKNQQDWLNGIGREPVLFFEGAWVSDGVAERIQFVPHQQRFNDAGLPINIDDYLRDGDVEHWLANWDWDSPQTITPTQQGTVTAEVRPQTSEFRSRDPAWWLLRMPRFETTEPRLSLRDYVGRFNDVRFEQPDDAQSPLRILLKNDRLGLTSDSAIVEVLLDPSADFQISRLTRTTTGKVSEKLAYAVEEIMTTPSGGKFPRRVTYTVANPQAPNGVLMGEYEVVKSSFDEPLDPSLFLFRFPENVQVLDSTGQADSRKWFLWGINDAPKAVIKSPMDLLDYDPVALAAMPKRSALFSKKSILINIAVACIVVAIVMLRRRGLKRRPR